MKKLTPYLSNDDPVREADPPDINTLDDVQNDFILSLSSKLTSLDPSVGSGYQMKVGQRLHSRTAGHPTAFQLWADWCQSSDDSLDLNELKNSWELFSKYSARSADIESASDENLPNKADFAQMPEYSTVLSQYSITGTSAEMESESLAQVYVLSGLAILGQWTVFYAKHNTGKTLIILHLLIEAILDNRIDASKLFYINVDDTHAGLTEKTRIAEEIGFHIICDGYRGFKASNFVHYVEQLSLKNQARGIVLVLDTLKKFTDLMDKRRTSLWGETIRRFIAKGGTVIGLAHVNKHPGSDGKPIYAGTSDIIDDADCAYVMDLISKDDKSLLSIVEFECKKRRGNVLNRAAYSYCHEENLSYHELLASVTAVDDFDLEAVKQTENIKNDAEVINAVVSCIAAGINTKMRLRDAVCSRIGCSRRAAIHIIEKYEGDDPSTHKWTYSVRERGAKVYALLAGGNCHE